MKAKTPESTQTRWRRRRAKRGLCIQCGIPAPKSTRCAGCLRKARIARRKVTHSKPYNPNKRRGRPPIVL